MRHNAAQNFTSLKITHPVVLDIVHFIISFSHSELHITVIAAYTRNTVLYV